MRRDIIELAFLAGYNGAHIAPSLSIVEILAVLYHYFLNYDITNHFWELRDRFILSKGHGALALYTALKSCGIITKEMLYTFEKNGGLLPGQPCKNIEIGIEYSSGSLGMGLSYGVGLALAAKKAKLNYKVFVLLGDGECNEGMIWEAAMSASKFKLDNLVVIVDKNNLQSDGVTFDILPIDLKAMWDACGWDHIKINDGNEVDCVYASLDKIMYPTSRPTVFIAQTVKGKGISFMENNNQWHHSVLTKENYEKALNELSC
jgi:transketolase